jgi:hypothetical protein
VDVRSLPRHDIPRAAPLNRGREENKMLGRNLTEKEKLRIRMLNLKLTLGLNPTKEQVAEVNQKLAAMLDHFMTTGKAC